METLKVKNIYAYNILKATKCDFSKENSYLHSLLLNVESDLNHHESSVEQFSPALMNAINSSHAFFKVDRVCLVLTYPTGTKLRAISVANSDKITNNLMPPNYSCFVSNNSSILRTPTSNIRLFSNIDDIINKYEVNHPVQRSLGYLKTMGLKSGIAIPLPVSSLVSGMLFLNSVEVGAFDQLQDENYSTLCLIKLIAQSTLNRTISAIGGIDAPLASLINFLGIDSNIFSVDSFEKTLGMILKQKFEKNINLKINDQTNSIFFYSSKPILYTITKALQEGKSLYQNDDLEIILNLEKEADANTLSITLKNILLSEKQISHIQSLKLFSEIDVSILNGSLVLKSPVELNQSKEIDYSV